VALKSVPSKSFRRPGKFIPKKQSEIQIYILIIFGGNPKIPDRSVPLMVQAWIWFRSSFGPTSVRVLCKNVELGTNRQCFPAMPASRM